MRGTAQAEVDKATGAVGEAAESATREGAPIVAMRGEEPGASTTIDRTVRGTLEDQGALKNDLYAEAKDAGADVPRDITPLKDAVAETRANVSPLVPEGYVLPKQVADKIEAAEKSNFKDIVGLRPALSDAIGEARAKGNGAMVASLTKLKSAVEAEGTRVQADAERIMAAGGPKTESERALVDTAQKQAAADANLPGRPRAQFREGEGGAFRQDSGQFLRLEASAVSAWP